MVKQVDNAQTYLEKAVSEVLFYVWDPIGVNGTAACRDEYDNYVPIITAYLLRNYNQVSVDVLLLFIIEHWIGLRMPIRAHRKSRHLETLRVLMDWKSEAFEKFKPSSWVSPVFPEEGDLTTQLNWSIEEAKKRMNH